MTQGYLSKAFSLYARLNWGLKDVKILSPLSFSGSMGEKTYSFFVRSTAYNEDFEIFLPVFNDDILILYLPEKKGDNLVTISRDDCEDDMGKRVTLGWLAPRIRHKDNITPLPEEAAVDFSIKQPPLYESHDLQERVRENRTEPYSRIYSPKEDPRRKLTVNNSPDPRRRQGAKKKAASSTIQRKLF